MRRKQDGQHRVKEPPVGALAAIPVKMEEVIAALEGVTFAFEQDVELQKGTGLLPFQGMDKSNSAVCNFFAKGLCEKGTLCPLRHEKGEKIVVCKHWLRGLCRKGDCCNFLHQYDIDRMPVCYFHSKFAWWCLISSSGVGMIYSIGFQTEGLEEGREEERKRGNCSNKDCSFLHVKPAPNAQDCPWYDRGFCKDGPLCKYHHVHQVMCLNYFTGFCPKGPKCQFGHPKMSQVLHPSNVKGWLQLSWTSAMEGIICTLPVYGFSVLGSPPGCTAPQSSSLGLMPSGRSPASSWD
ncbi:cleavage and polyadenylation specific factor 4-like [Cricetulus griseus]